MIPIAHLFMQKRLNERWNHISDVTTAGVLMMKKGNVTSSW